MTPEKIIELAQSVGLTLPKRGDYFFINHEDLGKLLVARSEACAKICETEWSCHEEEQAGKEFAHAIRSMDDQ